MIIKNCKYSETLNGGISDFSKIYIIQNSIAYLGGKYYFRRMYIFSRKEITHKFSGIEIVELNLIL